MATAVETQSLNHWTTKEFPKNSYKIFTKYIKTLTSHKICTQYVSKFGKLSSGHRTGKGQFFTPIPKKGNAKERSRESHLVVSESLRSHELYSPWNSPGQNTGVVASLFSWGSSQPRDQTQVSCIAGRFFTR